MNRALTVDLWDTLIYDVPEVDDARRDLRLLEIGKILQAAAGFDYQKSRERMRAAYETTWQWLEQTWQTGQEIVPSEQLRLYLNLLFEDKTPNNLPEPELLTAYLEPILVHSPFPMPGTRDVLLELKQRGWKLGLISNTGRTSGVYLRRLLQKHGVFELFDTFSFSDEFGRRKPDLAIFEKTLEALGITPERSFHLGDSWQADVTGAQKAGLTPLWFCRIGAYASDPNVRQVKNWPQLQVLLQD
ncbi:MAG TPA: HAD family hydrolase [Verrucomicrobiae bacterium]|nr:HAD family hydrolase [Verrucomicrobiae bacterium]